MKYIYILTYTIYLFIYIGNYLHVLEIYIYTHAHIYQWFCFIIRGLGIDLRDRNGT